MKFIVWIERHELGPRLHLLGRRIHEYHVGFAILAVSPVAAVARAAYFSPWTAVVALAGLWLVVKDWPDLFPATRDTASWRLGIHRLPCKENELRDSGSSSRTSPARSTRREATRSPETSPAR